MSVDIEWIVENEDFGEVVEDGDKITVYVPEDSKYHGEEYVGGRK
ncbi:MAG: hypothetical protein AABW63_01775 [Nanoarchaeota archaeon]